MTAIQFGTGSSFNIVLVKCPHFKRLIVQFLWFTLFYRPYFLRVYFYLQRCNFLHYIILTRLKHNSVYVLSFRPCYHNLFSFSFSFEILSIKTNRLTQLYWKFKTPLFFFFSVFIDWASKNWVLYKISSERWTHFGWR